VFRDKEVTSDTYRNILILIKKVQYRYESTHYHVNIPKHLTLFFPECVNVLPGY